MSVAQESENQAFVTALLDKTRILYSLRLTWYVLLVLWAMGIGGAYLMLRYAEPVYQAEALLRVTEHTEANATQYSKLFQQSCLQKIKRGYRLATFVSVF